ncbi:MAG: response regulator [Algicola sp.]|nr:response regulator [Algicola sp.]
MHRFSFSTFLLLWLSCVLYSLPAGAQTLIKTAPYAKLITTLGNFNLGEANTIYQSKKGYIWIGTNDGLVRFDGLNAKRFVHDANNPHSLQHNQVFGITQDINDNLWVSTYGGGLSVYSPKTARFKPIDLKVNPQDPDVTDLLYSVVIDQQNRLWIGSSNGLKLVDTISQTALAAPNWLTKVSKKMIASVFIDQQQNIWIPTVFDGLYWYDNHTLHHFKHDAKDSASLNHNRVRTVYQDAQNTIWVGSQSGLSRFERSSTSFTHFSLTDSPELSYLDNDIYSIEKDDYGTLWLGTTSSVVTFDPKSQKFNAISGTADINKKFRTYRVNKLLKDRDGALWFAAQSGVVYLPKTALQFNYYSNDSGTFRVTDIDLPAFGSPQQQMTVVGNFKAFEIDLNNHQAKSLFPRIERFYRITDAPNGDLWISTFGSGLHHYNRTDKSLTPLLQDTFLLEENASAIYDIYIDNQHRFWLLSYTTTYSPSGGLARYFPDTNQFVHTLNHHGISDILQLDNNTLMLSSNNTGLYLVDINDFDNPAAQQNIANAPQSISTLYQDTQNRIWLGSPNQGLVQFHPKNQSFTFYSTADGLLSNSISTIIEDNEGLLWLGSTIGLTRFDPNTKQVLNIEQQDGLSFTAFRKRTARKHHDGKIFMGTKHGVVMFDPKQIKQTSGLVKVTINDFKLFNQPVNIHSEEQPTVLKQAIEFTQQLTLSYQHSVFSFHFSAIEYHRPDKIEFAYRMRGIDDNWIYTDPTNPIATYTTLSAKEYVFEVKAKHRDGDWPEQSTSINVTINPPPWLTWQAYLAYFSVAIATLYLYVRRRTLKLVLQAHILERNVAERTRQLQLSTDQLAAQKQTVSDLLAQKQQLFANVSHEFRTPLTLILSPVEQLLSRYANEPFSQDLQLIKRSGRRLLRMVDQLLEFAKLEQGDSSHTERVCVKQTVDLVAASFEPLLKTKALKFTVLPFEPISVMVIADSLNKILINLLSNAAKYTPAEGYVEVSVCQHGEQVDISVTDSGIGISEQDQPIIFQRFNRAIHAHEELVPGAGIGLALVKELVEANKGHIELSSELGKGSTFVVTLPVAKPESNAKPMVATELSEQQLDLEIDSIITPSTDIAALTAASANDNQLKTILIIDDNADLRTLLHNQLTEHYHCIVAENGKRGLELANEYLPDLVLSDVMMPVMDGYQLAQALKSATLTSHIPIILLTAKGSVQSRIKGLQLLVDDYLAKPFNIEELLLRINNILTIRDILKSRFAQAIGDNTAKSADVEKDHIDMTIAEQRFFNQVSDYLEQHFEDPQISAKSLYSALNIGEKQLQRKLKSFFNLSFPELVRNFRLKKALELLDVGQRASSVYHAVGFSSHSYFSQCFKAKFGHSPKAYQQLNSGTRE